MDLKVCLNLVKLDQLCAIALMKREEILRVYSKLLLWQPDTAFGGFT